MVYSVCLSVFQKIEKKHKNFYFNVKLEIKLLEYSYTFMNAFFKTNILKTTHDGDHTAPRSNYAWSLWIEFSHITIVSAESLGFDSHH